MHVYIRTYEYLTNSITYIPAAVDTIYVLHPI